MLRSLTSAIVLLAAATLACRAQHPQSTSAHPAAPVPQAVVQPGAPGEASTVIADKKVPAFHDPGYTSADVDFMQGMIHHHMQAIQMVAMIPNHTRNPQVRLLGEKIRISQTEEMKSMEVWLQQRGQAVPAMTTHGMTLSGRPMPLMMGMLSPAQMKALAAARGARFDRLFLTDMIQHHTGALEMVADLRTHAGAGLEPNIADFATGVDTDQRMEIDRMNGLLGRKTQ